MNRFSIPMYSICVLFLLVLNIQTLLDGIKIDFGFVCGGIVCVIWLSGYYLYLHKDNSEKYFFIFIVSVICLLSAFFWEGDSNAGTISKTFFVGVLLTIIPFHIMLIYMRWPRSGEIIASMAIRDGLMFLVKILIEGFGVNPNAKGVGESLLWDAALNKKIDILKYLIEKGADIQRENEDVSIFLLGYALGSSKRNVLGFKVVTRSLNIKGVTKNRSDISCNASKTRVCRERVFFSQNHNI